MEDTFMTSYSTQKDAQQPLPVAAAYAVPNPNQSSYPHGQWQSVLHHPHHPPQSDYPYAVHATSTYSYSPTNDQRLYAQRQPSPIHDTSMIQTSNTSPLSYYTSNSSSAYSQAPRPPSVVHEGFARARSTSYSGPYSGPYSSSPVGPGIQTSNDFSHSQYQSVRMPVHVSDVVSASTSSIPEPSSVQKMQNNTHTQGYYTFSPTANAPSGATYYSMQEEATPISTPVPMGNGYASNGSYSYTSITQPSPMTASIASSQLTSTLVPPIVPLANSLSTTGNNTIPRSMSLGNIPPHGNTSFNTSSFSGSTTPFSGRTTPSGVLTPGSGFAVPNGSGFSRSTRLAVPSLTIPSNLSNMYMDNNGDLEYSYNSAGVSPTTPVVLSSLVSLRGSGSGPGTASNGGSVPLTPTTDDTVSWACYDQLAAGLSRLGTNVSNAEGDMDDEDEDNDEGGAMLSIPSRMRNSSLGGGGGGSNGSSPRRAIAGGVTRTEKKRRSVTLAAGPSAAVQGVSRSRSGTMLGGLAPLTSVNPALSMSPVETSSPANTSMGANGTSGPGVLERRDSSSIIGNGPGSASASSSSQGNSPLAMKELNPSIKPIIEDYLLRYLNHLCMNPNAKDRMGHQIHQMYTARRIQRYEQLYGWRPLKFRIEAFVNGFVDLLTASGLSQDITMKIPHYLNNSKLFSRFNESGNRMKSQGQTIWRVRARCRTDIPGVDGPTTAAAATQAVSHPPSAFPQIQHSQQDDGALMLCSDPLLWEFLPYERCIVGQPPLAIVGAAWQWNLKVHDHWTPRKKVSWSLVAGGTSTPRSSTTDGDSSSPSASSTASNSLPKWLTLHGSKLKGTPTQPGEYPISVEATFQEDNDPEPVIVRGQFKIQVSKAIGGWKNKAAVSSEGLADSPTEAMEEAQAGGSEFSGSSGAHALAGGGASDSMGGGGMGGSEVPLVFGARVDYGFYGQSQGERGQPQFVQAPYPYYGYAH